VLFQNGHSFYYRTRENLRTDLTTMDQTVRPDPGLQDTTQFNEWTLRGAYSSALRAWKYTLGYDVNLQSGESGKLKEGGVTQQEYAGYAQVSRGFWNEKLVLHGGFRGGYHSRYSPPVIPSFNVLFRASDHTRLRASYARGFRAPSLKERFLEFIDNNHRIIGAEGLKAERSHHVQTSFSWDAVEGSRNRLAFTATGFFNDVTDGIALAATDPTNSLSIDYTYANIARQQNAIGTLQAEWKRGAVDGQVGYSYLHTFAQAGEYEAFSAQEITSAVRATCGKFVFSAFYKYTGDQPALVPAIDGSATYLGNLPAYHTLDASLSRKLFSDRVQIIAGVKNILDVQTIAASGAGAAGIHTGSGDLSLLPRRVFTTLRVDLGG
jgi:outer membrane receptor for ferrienterochelin and colicins